MEYAKSVRGAAVFLRFPTIFWTARPSIRSRRRSRNTVFPFWCLLHKSFLKVMHLRAVLEAFWFKCRVCGPLEALLFRSRCQGHGTRQNSAQTYIKPEAKVYLSDKAYD